MKDEKGFTLLELLVALSVTAMVVAAVAMSFMTWLRAEEHADAAMEKMRGMQLAIIRVRDTISTAYIPFRTNRPETYLFNGENASRPGEPFDTLTFDSISHRTQRVDAKQSDLAEMTLYTVPDASAGEPDKCRILRLREGGTINDRFEVEGGMVMDLAHNVTRFQLFYLDPSGDLKQEWKLTDTSTLPCAVVVWLGSGCVSEEQDECLMVPLKLTNVVGCQFEPEQLVNVCNINKF